VTVAAMAALCPVSISEGERTSAGTERAVSTFTMALVQEMAAGPPVLLSFTLTE
jgi:hypothetical protein